MKELRESVDIHKAYYKVRNKKEVEYFHLVHNLPARSFNLMESVAFQSETKRFQLDGKKVLGAKSNSGSYALHQSETCRVGPDSVSSGERRAARLGAKMPASQHPGVLETCSCCEDM